MDSLPVELLRLIYEYCDPPTVRSLRSVSRSLASIGYDYLLPPHFTSVLWRDDIARLHSIAGHEHLRTSIESVTFNFAKLEDQNRKLLDNLEVLQYLRLCPGFEEAWHTKAWNKEFGDPSVCYDELLQRAQGSVLPAFSSRGSMIEDALTNLPKLKSLEVTFTQYPYEGVFLKELFGLRVAPNHDRKQARKNINAIVSALRHRALSSLAIDRLPLELLKVPEDRKHWFDCADSFASLSRLDLTLDIAPGMLPKASFRAVNGLGHVLQFSPKLKHLSLGFINHANPTEKFNPSFRDLFGEFTFEELTDLTLEGIMCAEHDLSSLILRHAPTLERLRLGGRGLASPSEMSMGGITLYEGNWRSLLRSLRGKLPKLKRFHMEGDMRSGEYGRSSSGAEVYIFHCSNNGTSDKKERSSSRPTRLLFRGATASCKKMDCLALERYLLHGGEYPLSGRSDG